MNPLSCTSRVSLHGCLLIMSLAFSTFFEGWGLQEQYKWYLIPRALDTAWVTTALKMEPLLLWTLEFKIPLTSWEVSTIRFFPLVNFWALDISKTIVAITLKECGHSFFFSKEPNADTVGKLKVGACKKAVWRALKAFWVSGDQTSLLVWVCWVSVISLYKGWQVPHNPESKFGNNL